MNNEEWRMKDEEWRMKNEEWKNEKMELLCRSPTEQRSSLYHHLPLLSNRIKKVNGYEESRINNGERRMKDEEQRISASPLQSNAPLCIPIYLYYPIG